MKVGAVALPLAFVETLALPPKVPLNELAGAAKVTVSARHDVAVPVRDDRGQLGCEGGIDRCALVVARRHGDAGRGAGVDGEGVTGAGVTAAVVGGDRSPALGRGDGQALVGVHAVDELDAGHRRA